MLAGGRTRGQPGSATYDNLIRLGLEGVWEGVLYDVKSEKGVKKDDC